ncbi:hypothetical protein [Haloplanus halophilus]|uniref:hypothetical protein n=1 Tax=Haloplanus halophilus TaxID=2949993 RepID=UPI00203C215F|nr:hypothetical protein [Haloplanus sp. GDY1]
MTRPTTVEAVDTMVRITDGRVSMTASSETTARVHIPDRQPLAAIETHATIRVDGPDYKATLELDADAAAALHAALEEAINR